MFGLLTGISLGVTLSLCPDPSLHETSGDCPWAAIARAARSDPRVIASAAPALWATVARDRTAAALHAAWGQSRNLDEHEHAPIVDAGILSLLGKQLGVPGDGEVVHAGLEHTYGYLLSTLWTAYGYKRARWVDGELERGLGLEAGFLGPAPSTGTLYSNVTCVLARLVFSRASWDLVSHTCAHVPVAARTHDGLREEVGTVALRTDWFALSATRWLLVYSASVNGRERLLTSFPVDKPVIDGLIAQPLGERVDIVARYNAVVPELSASAHGKRRVVHVAAATKTK
ncbi:MAG: hypothetical protein ABI321_19475 [Polyangia bacterium]